MKIFSFCSSKHHSLYKLTSGSPEARSTGINRGAVWATVLSADKETLYTDVMPSINQKKKVKLFQDR